MSYVKLIKEVVMSDGSDSDLTVGKVYQVHQSNWPHYGYWFVLNDTGEQHHFAALDSEPDSEGFQTSDYWEEV